MLDLEEGIKIVNSPDRHKLSQEEIKHLDNEIKKLYELTKKDTKDIIDENIEITPIESVDKEKIPKEEKMELEKIGANIIKNDEFAVVTLAGGQGTRLGFDGPKGAYELELGKFENGKIRTKSIFEILADTLKKSKEKYGVLPYWYIMTSSDNDWNTKFFFRCNNYFGYDEEKVKFFMQENIIVLTQEGKIREEDGKIKVASNGNGGVYKALKKEKILDDMKEKNVKWVYICGIDNILAKPVDPILIGLTIKKNLKAASKSVLKAYPEENVGVYCRKNGKPSNIEYIEIPENMRNSLDENGNLKFGDANIVSYLFSIDVLNELADCDLKYHVNIKKEFYKFEKFIFDALEYFDDMLILRVKREEEFAPIKNKEGKDSPETAAEAYLKYEQSIN